MGPWLSCFLSLGLSCLIRAEYFWSMFSLSKDPLLLTLLRVVHPVPSEGVGFQDCIGGSWWRKKPVAILIQA